MSEGNVTMTIEYLIFLFFFILICVYNRRDDDDDDLRQSLLPQKESEEKEILEQVTIDKNNLYNYNNCCICLENYKEDDTAVITGCEHIYHKDCLQKWINNKNSCPLCNKKLNIIFS